jgi:hypothetical protein
MSKRVGIEIFDVTAGEWPSEDDGAVAFIWGGLVFSGWPLVDWRNEYAGQRGFASPEQARYAPLNVAWEASEDRVSGAFSSVRHWFRVPVLTPSSAGTEGE